MPTIREILDTLHDELLKSFPRGPQGYMNEQTKKYVVTNSDPTDHWSRQATNADNTTIKDRSIEILNRLLPAEGRK